jgi:hypothetical protein
MLPATVTALGLAALSTSATTLHDATSRRRGVIERHRRKGSHVVAIDGSDELPESFDGARCVPGVR